MKRSDGRRVDQLRPVRITRNFLKYAEGSALIEMGNTKVICAATVEESIPHHKRGSGEGWVTAEYAMLPRAGTQRSSREVMRPKGRSQEIQRLIGRSLRAVINLGLLGERTIILDSDVIQADGGTRTASITGAYVALHEAIKKLLADKKIEKDPLTDMVAAISVGRINGSILLDLNYEEDFQAQVDMNVVMTASGGIIEVQGTAEGAPFSQKDMDEMMKKASAGVAELIKIQKRVLKA